jgi:hypothetical protein
MESVWIHDSIMFDTPEYAVFGEDTYGIVDEDQGGVIAYVHRDNAQDMRDAWVQYRKRS